MSAVPGTATPLANHIVQFFEDGLYPADRIADYLRGALESGHPALAVATQEHLELISEALRDLGIDPVFHAQSGTLVQLDARETLARFMGPVLPDPQRTQDVILGILAPLEARSASIRVYGEMVDVLAMDGRPDAALRLEELWNSYLQRGSFRLLCGYALDRFHAEDGAAAFDGVCAGHVEVRPAAVRNASLPADHDRTVADLQFKNGALKAEIARRREIERERTQLFGQAQAATDRLVLLQRITSALSEALSPEDIANVVVTEMAVAVDADEAMFVVPGADSGSLQVLRRRDADGEQARGAFPAHAPEPIAVAFRTGAAVCESSPEIADGRDPAIGPRGASIACLPLAVGGRRLGAIGFGFGRIQRFTGADRAFLDDLARQASLGLERARLYDEARSAGEALREANRRKDEFLAILGHELRNPLSPIMTALQLMKLRGDAGCEKERAVIERQVLHVNRLVDDLLDVSRITQGKLQMKKQRVELASVVARAIEQASPLIESRAHRLTVEVPEKGIVVEVDGVRFAQALSNLLTNAAKYSERGGHIVVRCAREGAAAKITVSDTGMGLHPDALATIFEPFVQVQRTLERSQGGLGLGLALVKSLVQLHGGEVQAASDGPGKGSRFSITIPAVVGHEAFAAPAGARLAAATVVRRVLLVDDNCDAADFLAEMLRLLGHEVVVAYDASAALEKAESGKFDVAILDLSLPVIDGYELAQRLNENAKSRALRLIALTGYGTEDDRARTKAAGFEAHFVKPVDHDRLLRLLAAKPSAEITH